MEYFGNKVILEASISVVIMVKPLLGVLAVHPTQRMGKIQNSLSQSF